MAVTDVTGEGIVRVPGFDLPLSQYMSQAAKATLIHRMRNPFPSVAEVAAGQSIERVRRDYDTNLYRGQLAEQRARYAVNIDERTIAGVTTDVVTPKTGVPAHNRNRVLINLHGGGFLVGARLGGQIESVPIAALAQMEVVSVDYREAPEYVFPAASEDVAKVYRELLKRYDPKSIGLYGISAGGFLTAQAVAWFQHENLPIPGAIGIFSAGAGLVGKGGDSIYLAPATAPVLRAPSTSSRPASKESGWISPYFAKTDVTDWRVSPELHPEVLAKFPPTMLAAGGRDWLLSRTTNSHRKLLSAGVRAELHVWDGMWHGWNYEADLPESQDFYGETARFFDRHLQ